MYMYSYTYIIFRIYIYMCVCTAVCALQESWATGTQPGEAHRHSAAAAPAAWRRHPEPAVYRQPLAAGCPCLDLNRYPKSGPASQTSGYNMCHDFEVPTKNVPFMLVERIILVTAEVQVSSQGLGFCRALPWLLRATPDPVWLRQPTRHNRRKLREREPAR